MELPFIVQAFQVTRSGDALIKEQIVNNEIELASFNKIYGKYKLVAKELGEIEIDPESRAKIIKQIITLVPSLYAVSVQKVLTNFRSTMQEKEPNYFFRVKNELKKEISTQLVQEDKRYKVEFINNDYFISFAEKQSLWKRLTTHPSWGFYGAVAAIVTIPIGILLVTNPTFFTCNKTADTKPKNTGDTTQVKTKQPVLVFDTSMKTYKPTDSKR